MSMTTVGRGGHWQCELEVKIDADRCIDWLRLDDDIQAGWQMQYCYLHRKMLHEGVGKTANQRLFTGHLPYSAASGFTMVSFETKEVAMVGSPLSMRHAFHSNCQRLHLTSLRLFLSEIGLRRARPKGVCSRFHCQATTKAVWPLSRFFLYHYTQLRLFH